MSLRSYLLLMSIGTALCWTIWFIIVKNIDPTESGSIAIFLFYISLFLSLIGTFSVIGFLVKSKWRKNSTVIFHHVRHAFKQGLLISTLVICTLLLKQFRLLNYMTGFLLVVLFLIIESIFFANRKHKNKL